MGIEWRRVAITLGFALLIPFTLFASNVSLGPQSKCSRMVKGLTENLISVEEAEKIRGIYCYGSLVGHKPVRAHRNILLSSMTGSRYDYESVYGKTIQPEDVKNDRER